MVLNGRNARGSSHQQHAAQLGRGDAGVVERGLHGTRRALHQIARHVVERGARERGLEVQRARRALRQEREVDMRGIERRKLLLRLAGRLGDALHGRLVAPQVNPMLALEGVQQVRSHALVEVVAAQMVVARRGQHLNDVVADLDDRHVERAAAQVVHHHLLRRAVVQAVGESCSRGLVDDAQHVEACNAPGVLRGLALRIVEVRGHRDNRLRDILAKKRLGIAAQFAQDHGRQLLRRVGLAVDVGAPIAAHAALDRLDGAVGVHRRLAARDGSHQALAFLRKRDHAGRGALPFRVRHDNGPAALHRSRAAVRRS